MVSAAKNPKRDSSPVRGGDAVRRALVEATARALAEAGPSAVSVREVARLAGVNHDSLMTRLEISDTDLDFKAKFAAIAALQLGWAALEDFVLLISDVDESEREAVRDRVKVIISNWFGPLPAP